MSYGKNQRKLRKTKNVKIKNPLSQVWMQGNFDGTRLNSPDIQKKSKIIIFQVYLNRGFRQIPKFPNSSDFKYIRRTYERILEIF